VPDVYLRNHNPRLRILLLASDVRIDLVGRGDCGAGSDLLHDMGVLISDVNHHSPNLYFTLTVAGGAVATSRKSLLSPPAEQPRGVRSRQVEPGMPGSTAWAGLGRRGWMM
jgi:hypothetical protein